MGFDGGFDGVPAGGGGGGDAIPPTDSASTPVSIVYGEVRDAAVTINVVDAASAIGLVAIAVKYSGSDVVEAIMLGVDAGPAGSFGGFQAPYAGRVNGTGAAGDGYQIAITREGGWPADEVAQFIVKATDTEGNILV